MYLVRQIGKANVHIAIFSEQRFVFEQRRGIFARSVWRHFGASTSWTGIVCGWWRQVFAVRVIGWFEQRALAGLARVIHVGKCRRGGSGSEKQWLRWRRTNQTSCPSSFSLRPFLARRQTGKISDQLKIRCTNRKSVKWQSRVCRRASIESCSSNFALAAQCVISCFALQRRADRGLVFASETCNRADVPSERERKRKKTSESNRVVVALMSAEWVCF